MSKHKIAVISDTHGMLRPEVIEEIKKAEKVLHAGDVANRDIFNKIKALNEVNFVQGNCDRIWGDELPHDLLIELFGKKLYLIHNKQEITPAAKEADIVIYGHSHIYNNEEKDGQLWLNPGSAGPRRFGRPATMVNLIIDSDTGEIEIEKIDLDVGEKPEKNRKKRALEDTGAVLDNILKELHKGWSADRIAKKHKLNKNYVNQICQLYFTHPGISKEGILNRLDILDL